MDFWLSALVSLVLLLLALGMIVWHVYTWRNARARDLCERERQYYWRQFRRRTQASAMAAVLAMAIFVSQLIPQEPLVAISYYSGMLLLTVWVILLAVADMISTKHHFSRLRQQCLIEQAKLKAELRRIHGHRGNGKSARRDQVTPDR